MCALDETRSDEFAHSVLRRDFQFDIEPRRQAFLASMTDLQEMRSPKAVVVAGGIAPGYSANKDDHIPSVFEKLGCDMPFVFDQADHCYGRSWIDDSGRALII